MCTFILAWQTFETAPMVVAANRDERLERPSELPKRREWQASVVAPTDAEAGGTWIGYNEHDVLIAITNRWTDRDGVGDRSRGLLVRDVLGSESASAAIRTVEHELDERDYDGFNLVAVDPKAALLVEYDGNRTISTFDPGVHVVVNVGADGRYRLPKQRKEAGKRQASNADSVRTALRPEPGEGHESWLDRAREVIADHEYGVCVHGDGFGTRSSSLIHLTDDSMGYEYADGPPCETSFEHVDATL